MADCSTKKTLDTGKSFHLIVNGGDAMKKYNVLSLISFILSLCSVVIPFVGMILPFITVVLLVIVKQNIRYVSEQNKHFIKASMIISCFGLLVWTFALLMTFLSYTSLSEDFAVAISIIVAIILTLVAVWYYDFPPKKKPRKIAKYAKLRGHGIDGKWTCYEYEVAPYGYEFMLRLAQIIIDHADNVAVASTAKLAGMPEIDHIEELKSNDNKIANCKSFQNETGCIVLGVLTREPYLDDGYAIKICMFNQLNFLRFFVFGHTSEHQIDYYVNTIVKEAMNALIPEAPDGG